MKAGPGRPKGSKNKMTGAHEDLLAAWDKVAGPETAKKLMRAALEEAIGKGVTVKDKFGHERRMTVRDFDPLRALLPYIARKMPAGIEVGRMKYEDLLDGINDWKEPEA